MCYAWWVCFVDIWKLVGLEVVNCRMVGRVQGFMVGIIVCVYQCGNAVENILKSDTLIEVRELFSCRVACVARFNTLALKGALALHVTPPAGRTQTRAAGEAARGNLVTVRWVQQVLRGLPRPQIATFQLTKPVVGSCWWDQERPWIALPQLR